tara:strand:+ start:44801 stop:45739 length:939 start_codon:yes stop_codon:yes gene_type:complete
MSNYPAISGPDLESDPLLAQLITDLQVRHHGAICCTLLYGSCLRSGNIYDGLLDLYLICDSYRSAYQRNMPAIANWLLPPNVFYAELTEGKKTLRSKVTVISLRDFQRGCSKAWFQSYIWGRFAQPTRLLAVRNDAMRSQIEESLLQAGRTLLANALPALPDSGTVVQLWEQALALSYSTELRTERSGRANELVLSAVDFYTRLTHSHAGSLAPHFAVYDDGQTLHYRYQTGTLRRLWCRLAWALRKGQGKLLSILRLLKALFTFEGGLDYIAWKLERHSGEKIDIPERVRKAPLLFLWGFFWSLYRRGIFK